jgi:unsaturated rhamnogalacturonyl hydrolase
MTSDSLNNQQLWDDTLFMTVLFLANMGRIEEEKKWKDEAEYQFLLHLKYLTDRASGLWYHGWSFEENNNFAEALWGRGNCWITVAIPEFLEMSGCEGSVKRMLTEALKRQTEALIDYQDPDGMWHTLIDDPHSYEEASATCGFAYGMLKGVHMGLLDESCRSSALKAIEPILSCTDETGILNQVSYGTPMGRNLDFYRNIPLKPMPYGQALAMLFLSEAIKDM